MDISMEITRKVGIFTGPHIDPLVTRKRGSDRDRVGWSAHAEKMGCGRWACDMQLVGIDVVDIMDFHGYHGYHAP
jgi:hypothetical protein